MTTNRAAPILFRMACLAGLLSLAFWAYGQGARAAKGKTTHTTTSRDGTRITYDRQGTGPALIVVGGALSDRSGAAGLADLLAARFTVYSYDRRGRGGSTDTLPYAVEREIEDIEALIDSAGGTANVYGKSSGASLALRAAAALGSKVVKLALYEAPYNDTEGAASEWRVFRAKLDEHLAAGRRAEAITLFMGFVGAPDDVIAQMKASPAWPGMLAMAHTLAYDNAVVGDDWSVPVDIAARITAPTLVMDGGASLGPLPYMRQAADRLGQAIPAAQRLVIEGQSHDVSPEILVPHLLKFFS
ncbi:MAG TPA: alpha/beta hydrolase [Rhizobacter sp.]|nr:alpha/beta hydrolase [Rhizobacter sp.]